MNQSRGAMGSSSLRAAGQGIMQQSTHKQGGGALSLTQSQNNHYGGAQASTHVGGATYITEVPPGIETKEPTRAELLAQLS